jgi:hypothetical protein
MAMKHLKFLTALLMVLGSTALVGCGDDNTSGSTPGFTCGTGTKEESGACVPDGTATPGKTCGAGTVAQGDECVAQGTTNPITCGAGTKEENGKCVPTDPGGPTITCGAGTVNDGNDVCVPEDSFTCGEGTIAEGNVCVRVCPDGTIANATGGCDVEIDLNTICSPGTYQFEGRCLSYEEFVREEAAEVVTSGDTPTAQDDPFIYTYTVDADGIVTASSRFSGGTPVSITAPAEGSTLLLTGDVALLGDLTGDGVDDQDWDVYALQGTAGQVLRLSVASEGLPSPYVEVLRFDGVSAVANIASELGDIAAFNEAQSYARLTPIARGLSSDRKVLIPTDGLYFIRVTDGSFGPPTFYVCDEFDEIFSGCPVGTTFLDDPGFASGGPGYNYRLGVETLPMVDFTAVTAIDLNATSTQTWSGDKDSYGQVDTEIALVRKETTDPNGEPGFLEVSVTSYDDKAYGTGILTIGDATDVARSQQGIGAEGVRFSIPLPPQGWIIGHDNIVAQGYAKNGYNISLKAAPELTEDVDFVSSMDDAPDGDLGFSRDHFFVVPKGNIAEITATNIGDGITPILSMWSVGGIAENFEVKLLGCAGAVGTVNPAVCAEIPDGEPLSVVRYFGGAPGETQNISVIMLDAETGEGTNFGFTLTPTITTPSTLSLDDTAGDTSDSVEAGALDSQTGNTARWSVLTITPGTAVKSLDISSTPAAASTAVLTTTLYTQVDPEGDNGGSVLVNTSDTAGAAAGATTLSMTAPSTPTTFLIKNALSGAPQSTTTLTVDADLTSIPTLSGANDLCSAPQVVAMSGAYVVDLFDATANYTSALGANVAAACGSGADSTGDNYRTARSGPDSFFSVTVPAGGTLEVSTGGTGDGDDTVVFILDATATVCADAATGLATCLASDDDSGTDFFSAVSYTNSGAAARNVLVVVDNWNPTTADGDANSVTFNITAP